MYPRGRQTNVPRKPRALRPGDTVAVIAPGAAVEESRLASGVACLEKAGLCVRLGQAVLERDGYLAGSDDARVRDLHVAFADPEVVAVIAARGGYGCGRLLPYLDRDLIRSHPKIFVGHSDVTFLLTEFTQRLGMLTFHGPMALNLPVQQEGGKALFAMLEGEQAGWQITVPEVIQDGIAEAPLSGGCLSIVTAALGTRYALDPRGTILFLEDVNEKPFRIDRMLTQLRQSGALDEVAGVVFGEMSGCAAHEGEPRNVRDVVCEAFAGAPYPVVFGVPSGHGTGSVTLPLGLRARLAGDSLVLLESPVVDTHLVT